MRFLVFHFICFFVIQICCGQSLYLLDDIGGRYGAAHDLQINADGDRFYLIKNGRDSIIINNSVFYLPGLGTDINDGYPDITSYLFTVPSNESIPFYQRPGGEVMRLTDTSVLVFTALFQDTFITDHGTYYNKSEGIGTDLLLSEYDFNGNFIQSKQWEPSDHLYYYIDDVVMTDSSILITGVMQGSGAETLGLSMDGLFLLSGHRRQNFIAYLDSDWKTYQLFDVEGFDSEYESRSVLNNKGNLLISGTSGSEYVTSSRCEEDTLIHQSNFPWSSSFNYLYQFDAQGNCVNSNAPIFDFNGGLALETAVLSDGSYLLTGVHGASYLTYDNVTIENPSISQSGYIFKFSGDLVAQVAIQLEGSGPVKRISDLCVDEDDNIWMTGWSFGDTLIVADSVFYKHPDDQFIGFYAKLDSDLNLLTAKSIGGEAGWEITGGADGNLYLLTTPIESHTKVYQIVDSFSSSVEIDRSAQHRINLFPNPTTAEFYFELVTDGGLQIKSAEIYRFDGMHIVKATIDASHGSIQLDATSGFYFVRFILSDGSYQVKKLILQ
jgi:hypothetical protein